MSLPYILFYILFYPDSHQNGTLNHFKDSEIYIKICSYVPLYNCVPKFFLLKVKLITRVIISG